MKILVAYFSLTGNTEKVAKAVHEQARKNNDADIKKMTDVGIDELSNYDFVFVGTPIHAGGLAGAAKKFIEGLPESAPFAVAGLVTHSSDLYMNQAHERGLNDLENICKGKSINYLGCFHCQGKLAPNIQPMVQKAQKVSDEEWKKRMDETDKHPSEEDIANACAFADQAMQKIQG